MLSEALINEAVEEFRDIIAIERTWTYADWLGATAAMILPMAFAPFGALLLPRAKDMSKVFTDADGPDAEDERTYESVVYPYAATALGPLVSMIIVSATGRGLARGRGDGLGAGGPLARGVRRLLRHRSAAPAGRAGRSGSRSRWR